MDENQKVIYSVVKNIIERKEKECERTYLLIEALNISKKEVVSIVGAGGKTTLMFRLAKELVLYGKNVLTVTTTKIMEPSKDETPFVLIDKDEERIKGFIAEKINHYQHITVGSEILPLKKLKGVSPSLIDVLSIYKDIDVIINEADGAAGRPIKAPREMEPVIPSSTSLVVAILGIDAVGMRLSEENVFQAERVSRLTGIPMGEMITEEVLAILMTHPEGVFKGKPSSSRAIAFINKVDIKDGINRARKVAQGIIERENKFIERIILGQLKNDPPVIEVFLP